jgi:hypothetical protein
MQQREEPIEGVNDSQATPPTRTGDDMPTSTLGPTEITTMGAVPFLFSGTAALIAVVVMVIFIVLR